MSNKDGSVGSMLIKDLPISKEFKDLLNSLGYSTLYPPQQEAIEAGLLDGKSMLIATPTASGKTLIAMIASVRALEHGSKVVYTTPLRALANEKYDEFRLLESLAFNGRSSKVRVMISTGDYDSSGEELGSADIIITTNEKMDSLFRHRASWISDVGLFVFDEVHMLADRERGATLEMMLARTSMSNAQVLALSATVSNAEEIASWLNSILINTEWRPTKLVEGVYSHGLIHYSNGTTTKIATSAYGASIDLAIDALKDEGQALVFAESRKKAVSLALKAAEAIRSMIGDSDKAKIKPYIDELIEKDGNELAERLAEVMGRCVAFHHAGLSPIARRIVEDAFRDRALKILTATPTLAAGVNLPARRVIISSISRYDMEYGANMSITVNEYKQMCGRAGRPKYDTHGEAIIVAGSHDVDELIEHYINGEPEPLRSTLVDERMLRMHVLASIAMSDSISIKDLNDLFAHTLLARQYSARYITPKFESALEYLVVEGLVEELGIGRDGRKNVDRDNDKDEENGNGSRVLRATRFGRRVAMLYIDPETAVLIRDALTRIKRVKDKDLTLALLHLITECPDFYPKLQLRSSDVDEVKMLIDEYGDKFIYEVDEHSISRSLLALYAWIEEYSDKHLLNLGVEPGDMYRMVDSADWLLYSMYELALLLGKKHLLSTIERLRARVEHGVKEELLELVRLEGIGRVRARALYNAGFHDLKSIADASESRLASVRGIGYTLASRIREEASRLLSKK
ncbi:MULTISPECIES: DEAD/DEAH box helicase [Candidatus Nitrosocaldus]|jgi:helicase|uniref:ATP-dependent DNA helicase Hel308 n=1 Tax=Candidatus Nitrosocaldus cavascurensis TaxID=2058097 RepID=A0A2K5AQW4_9ARCH|nr:MULTISPECIES: DEAD/DEAH box helicase [Candidatus Nitrosocaldus]SPC34046.1 putative ATP-dependent DNA helicase Hel308 [Candidatus Nitrosocaldus cavascurensis]